MKIFNVSVKDNATHLEIIASDCSYNSACAYLHNNGCRPVKIIHDYNKNRTLIDTSKRLFVYDESRGFLLGD